MAPCLTALSLDREPSRPASNEDAAGFRFGQGALSGGGPALPSITTTVCTGSAWLALSGRDGWWRWARSPVHDNFPPTGRRAHASDAHGPPASRRLPPGAES